MLVRNCSIFDIEHALKKVNVMFDNNIRLYNVNEGGKRVSNVRFSLRVKDSGLSGGARSFHGRRTASACWHVHGCFFNELLEFNPYARIYVSPLNKRDKEAERVIFVGEGGNIVNNWYDWKVGAPAYGYVNASELCNCL